MILLLFLLHQEIVPPRKVCRCPEIDYRLQALQTSRPSAPVNLKAPAPNDPSPAVSNDFNLASQRIRKPHKLMDVYTNEVTTVLLLNTKGPITVHISTPAGTVETMTTSDVTMEDAAAMTTCSAEKQGGTAAVG